MKIAACLVLALASLGACEKTSDVAKLQQEATDLVSEAKPVYDDLDRQEKALAGLGSDMPKDDANVKQAGTALGQARGALDEMLATMSAEPVDVDKALKSGVTDNLVAVVDRLHMVFEHDETVARADITTVQDWMIQRGKLTGPLDH